uniref:Solute carrier family 5 (Inositol transporters), member 3 n=1 Tax=Schistosoma japonicum TaxID=6182 RepID=C1L3P7_SCHJA|nr:solute carrier family 5 (inositol transporters), member 3 [Schistosoma japonicum]
MRNRFGGSRIQIYLAIMSLFLYIFTKISVNLYSGSLFLTEALEWNTWLSIIILLSITAIITVTGFIKVGGFQGLLTAYGGAIAEVNISSSEGENLLSTMILTAEAKNITSLIQLSSEPTVDSRLKCALPSRKAFKLLREIDDPDMPWLGFLFGQTPSSIWYWCADQMMVQRTLAAKSLSHAQGATLMTGIIKQFPLFIIVIPGMISRVLYPNEIGCFPGSDCLAVCGHRNGCSNMAYPKLVVDLMPSGLRGLMLTVMIAALISDLTSIFNSASTLFTVDVYQKWRSSAQNTELMIVGRAFVIVLVALSVAWIPIIQHFQGDELYIYIQAIAAYLTPPIASVYLCAVLWKRCNEKLF